MAKHQPPLAAHLARLAAYYQPQSPLEHLQIQRIARCAAKLDALYAQEHATASLATLQSQMSDAHTIAQFTNYPPVARALALKLRQSGGSPLPLGLNDDILAAICHEINTVSAVLETEAHLAKAYPVMRAFLQGVSIQGLDTPFSMDHRLWVAAAMLRDFLDALQEQATWVTTDSKTADTERIFLKIIREKHFVQSALKGTRPHCGDTPYQRVVRDDLNVFLQLQQAHSQANQIIAQWSQVQSLLAASATLPPAEADRLLHQQTTLERQLSRYVAELLQLQAQTLARLSM